MDFSNLQDKVSNLSLYDLKAGVRKVQNGKSTQFGIALAVFHYFEIPGYRADRCVIAVMNYTEMEAKVRIPTKLSLRNDPPSCRNRERGDRAIRYGTN